MADLAVPRSDAPPSSRSRGREAQRAFASSSFNWCLAILAVAAALALVPLWAPVLLASWVALAVHPLHARLARRAGGRSGAASVITVLLVAAALLPLVVISLSLVSTGIALAKQLQGSGGLREALQAVFTAEPTLQRGRFDLQEFTQLLQRHGTGAWSAATTLFGAASAAVIGVFVFVYGFYVCLVDGRRAYAWILDHSPLERWQTERLAAAYAETGRGLLIGVGLTALFQGGVATVGYVIIDVPQALLLGMLTAISALIPSIGTGLVWAPLSVGLLAAGKTGAAIGVLVLGCAISVADNFIRPFLSRRAHLDLPVFVLFIAMVGGIFMFGTWGLLAGPLFVRLAMEALRLSRELRQHPERRGELIGTGRS